VMQYKYNVMQTVEDQELMEPIVFLDKVELINVILVLDLKF